MFAVIETGGKQYKVAEGDVVSVEKIPNAKAGDSITFDSVLLIDDGKKTEVGDPYLKGKKVPATIEKEGRGKKIKILRFHSKSNYMRRQGHRQPYMEVKIGKIA